jgi:hypothetical protein
MPHPTRSGTLRPLLASLLCGWDALKARGELGIKPSEHAHKPSAQLVLIELLLSRP